MKPLIPQTMTAVSVLALALAVGGCSSSSDKDDMDMGMPDPMPTPQEVCEDAGGRWNAGETCTSAADLAAEAAVAVAAATRAAGTKEMAIAAEAAQAAADDAGLGGSGVDTVAMTIARDRDGTTITIADSALAEEDDPKFMQAMDLGGGRTMHVRAMEADDDGNVVEEVVVVGTDIEAPTATAFGMVHTLDVTTDTDNDTPDVTNEALAVDQTDDAAVALVMSNAFTVGTGAELMFDSDAAATGDMDEAFEAAGTYNGAMGTYRCNGTADCTVTLDAEGMTTAMSDGWIFTPDMGATSDVPDADYLHYGFWLKRTTDEDGAVTYNEVETFAGSSLVAATTVGNVEGTASYSGGATGVYVRNVYNPDRTLDMATSGHFTADVTLMAYFGGDDVAVNKQNSIEGTIDDFSLSGGEDASGWGVNVEADIANNGLDNGTAKGGGAGDGSISGTFYGDDTNDDGDAIGPKVLAGEFNAEFTNGSVAGGFGARRQ